MRLDEREQTTKTPHPSPSLDRFASSHSEQTSIENQSDHIISESPSPTRDGYFAFVARATNDAVRDWDVKNGALSWPQGLESRFGYDSSTQNGIGFWQQNIHPADRARIAEPIRDSLAGAADRWSGDFRLHRSDGYDISIRERVLILRPADGARERVVGAAIVVTQE